jgi:hypothetical protein
MTKLEQEVIKRLKTKLGPEAVIGHNGEEIYWEESILSYWYHEDFAKFDTVLQEVCQGLNCYIELSNSCCGKLYKD